MNTSQFDTYFSEAALGGIWSGAQPANYIFPFFISGTKVYRLKHGRERRSWLTLGSGLRSGLWVRVRRRITATLKTRLYRVEEGTCAMSGDTKTTVPERAGSFVSTTVSDDSEAKL